MMESGLLIYFKTETQSKLHNQETRQTFTDMKCTNIILKTRLKGLFSDADKNILHISAITAW